MRRFYGILLVIFFLLALPALAKEKGLSLDEVITLKKLGYTNSQILKELERSKAKFRLDKEEIEKLRQAGIGPEVIEWMKKSAPRPEITVEMVIKWHQEGKGTVEILKKLSQGKISAFQPPHALKLMRAGIHPAVLYAMKGQALDRQAIESLAAKKTTREVFEVLLDMIGSDYQPNPQEALALIKMGVDSEVVKKLVKGEAKKVEKKTETTPDSGYGHYEHVGRQFRISYPSSWKVLRELKDSQITYYFTPQDVKEGKNVTRGVSLLRFHIDQNSSFYGLKLKGIFIRLLALLRAEEPGLKQDSKITSFQIGGKKALRTTFEGTLKEKKGSYQGFYAVVRHGSDIYGFGAQAPKEKYESMKPDFEKMMEKVRLGRPEVDFRKNKIESDVLVRKYKPSVVCVIAGNKEKWVSSGSGFIIRKDGYLVTNHHVVWNSKEKKYYSRFRIAWDSTLDKDPVTATLIGARREHAGGLIESLTLGGADIALLKIEAKGSYHPVPLVPLKYVHLGDNVVTMGFPRLDLFSDPSGKNLSLFVTKGVVVRFNRDRKGNVKSIYTDAKITHGNSGGPCFDLNTGGVYGINTFGAWHSIEKDVPKLKQLQLGDLVGYYGVIPLHYVFESFPQFSLFEAGYDRNFTSEDRLILAQDFFNQRLIDATLWEVDRILKDNPKDVDALLLKGLALFLKGKARAGMATLIKGHKSNESHFQTLLTLGTLYYHMKEYLKASDMVEKAVEVEKDSFQARMLRARVYLAIKRYDDGLKEAEKAIELVHGVLPDPYVLKGEILYAQNKLDEGKKSFEKAREANPWHAEAWLGLGEYYERKEMYQAAILEYGKLKRKMAKSAEAWSSIGRCYRKLKKYQKAFDFYHKAIQIRVDADLRPEEETLYQCAWIAQHALKKVDLALKIYRIYFNYYSSHSLSWRGHLEIARLYSEKGLSGLSWAHYSRAKAHGPEEKEIKEAEGKVSRGALGVDDLVRMVRLGYTPQVMIDLIRFAPLGFRITTKEELKKLAAQKIPVSVLIYIIKIQQTKGKGGGGKTGFDANQVLAKLAGKWRGRSRTPQGHVITMVLVIAKNGRFAMRSYNQQGYPLQTSTGVITVQSANRLVVQFQQPRANTLRMLFKLEGKKLVMGSGQQADVFYRLD